MSSERGFGSREGAAADRPLVLPLEEQARPPPSPGEDRRRRSVKRRLQEAPGGGCRIERFRWNRTATGFRRTAHSFTRLFRSAQEQHNLHVNRAVRALAAWQVRQNVAGIDYSHGALQDVLSFAGEDIRQQVGALSRLESAGPARGLLSCELASMSTAWAECDDGRSCVSCMVYVEGTWRILVNQRFANMFATKDEVLDTVEHYTVLPSFFYGSTVSQEDHEEFVGLLAKVFFQRGGQDTSNQDGVVLKCTDRHGANFLGFVKLELVALHASFVGLRFSVLPLPTSRYMTDMDMIAPSYSSVEKAFDFVS